jgi:hypothetical protein
MLTRPIVTALVLFAASAAAPSCKADRSKPRLSAIDAEPVSSKGQGTLAKEADVGGNPGQAGAASGTGAEGTRSDPKTEPPAGPKSQPAEPKSQPAGQKSQLKSAPAEPETEPAGAAKKAERKPTNLKVLPTSWSLAQVSDYMKKQVARGLGVRCTHCHEKGDFASDRSEHKKAARSMIEMTSALNRDYFPGHYTLSCFTCHKGKSKPRAPR